MSDPGLPGDDPDDALWDEDLVAPEADHASLPSLLDQLADDDPRSGWDGFRSRSVAEVLRHLERDLSQLLNTRDMLVGRPAARRRFAGTVAGYGLPDLTQLSPSNPQHRALLRRELESAIGRYEPRLRDVSVEEVATAGGRAMSLAFRVRAQLRQEEGQRPVHFTTEMERGGGRVTILMGERPASASGRDGEPG